MAVLIIESIPAGAFQKAAQRIDREASIGPMLDPSAYLDGRRFDNARKYTDILNAANMLQEAIAAAMKGAK
jgi:hypothetical protein